VYWEDVLHGTTLVLMPCLVGFQKTLRTACHVARELLQTPMGQLCT
jgi:hypothetical protein